MNTIGMILQIAGSLAFFIFGMKMMSDGIQRAAGSQLRNILRSMTKNRYLGVFTGFLITALVQSSSASTVMTVSFVNAGLMSLVESAGVMMGANIGTTVTGWLISVLGFKVKLAAYSVPLFAFGLPLLFTSRGRWKYWGEFIIGFAILFLGLGHLKEAVPNLQDSPEVFDWLRDFADWGFFSRVILVFIGALVTIIVQSSSAAMAITLTLCSTGILPFDVAAAMILGENIGTTITAEIASFVGNTNAKRSARIHSMFNIIGVTWMVILLPLALPFLEGVMNNMGILNIATDPETMPLGLSAFHTMFNLANVLLMLAFVPWLVRMAIWSVPAKEEDDEDYRLKFINTAARTPELATIELQKETAHFGEVTARMAKFLDKLLNEKTDKKRNKMLKKLRKYEEITDNIEIEITQYITKLSDQEITRDTSEKLRSILNICNDMERIGDLFFQISKSFDKKMENKIFFLPEQRANILELNALIKKGFGIMNKNLSEPSYRNVSKDDAISLEQEINAARDRYRDLNQEAISKPDYNVPSSMIYMNIINMLESVGDHMMNITESIVGEI